MKQGRATRVFCLVVHFSSYTHTHTHTHMHTHTHTPECPALLIFYLPCSVAFLPLCVFSLSFFLPLSLSLSLSAPSAQCSARSLVRSQTERNATPCDLSPTTRRGAGLDKGARGQLQSCARAWKKTHTDTYTESQVVSYNTHTLSNSSIVFYALMQF